MKISLIAAMANNRVIGNKGNVPWNLPHDLEWLKERLVGRYLLMGRTTYEEPQQELKTKKTIVLTSNPNYKTHQAQVATDLRKAFQLAEKAGETELMVVGGAKVYSSALSYADRIYLTTINANIDGDAFFPDFDREHWQLVYEHPHPKDAKHKYAFTFQILDRI